MKRLGPWMAMILGGTACSGDDNAPQNPGASPAAVTFWDDVEPIFETHCMACHQAGGLGPFRLDDYEAAKAKALPIRALTRARTMPPWSAASDGSCGDFTGSIALNADQIERIAAWADGGAKEGTPRAVRLPVIPSLTDATEFSTPQFIPEITGGPLAESDEYRCFLLDSGLTEPAFITASDVLPGTPEIVHHVLVMTVDPDSTSMLGDGTQLTNLEQMRALDAESPDRDGWPCFGMAGEAVNVKAVPVIWAPGQGIVNFPDQSGIPLAPSDKVVVQVHYNLADPAVRGRSDQTRIRFRMTSQVENVAFFLTHDPFLGSLENDTPDKLEPGRASAKYTWNVTGERLGLGDLPHVELHGVFPHMHQLGHTYRMNLDLGSGPQCAADVPTWDFHWQRMYFYAEPYLLTPSSSVEVTCDYDTSSRTDPVLPGWGTRNEMCLATLFVTVPLADLGAP